MPDGPAVNGGVMFHAACSTVASARQTWAVRTYEQFIQFPLRRIVVEGFSLLIDIKTAEGAEALQ